ncbi:N-acetylglucosaminyl deacetylase, LmbE family [Caldanaerobius fijiensis DSM 17918]|uniref:N-acetylglucosaminyl deacetylase, LmbE family n=1 Tax=Caldanaerobius fijiensis DSM 17918 TaxID=1121256 RepID=A0A1M5CNC7_9THEO|nr:PIG-L family deacetylase [Caldanaerobius fijiensis]SHF56218.1 N-acetylglucosaminyl deacetylase, LmbE family [Caldanaerobius fijiensis DSM 17918]
MLQNMKKYIYILVGLLLAFIILFNVMNFGSVIANIAQKTDVPTFDYPGSRIMIVAPHPDDESIGAAGVIREALKMHIPVKVVIFTSGESYKRAAINFSKRLHPTNEDFYRLGVQRQKESIDAMETLGLPRKDLIFLGFADGSLRFLWDDFWNTPRRSGGVWVYRSPYKVNVYRPGIEYTGQNVFDAFSSVVNSFKPTDIFYPDPNDTNPDHWAVSNFVVYTILQQKYHIREHTYLVHHPQWPVPWMAVTTLDENPPVDLKWERWQRFQLSQDEISFKKKALLQYRTQIEIMQPFLMAFVRKSELFGYVPRVSIPLIYKLPSLDVLDKTNDYIAAKSIDGMFSQEIYKSADLGDLRVFRYNDALWVGLTTKAPLSNKVVYQLQMRIFYKDNSIKRLDVGIIKGKLVVYHRASNSITDWNIVNMRKFKRNMWYEIKLPEEEKIDYIFMGSQALYRGRLISRIPWKVYNYNINDEFGDVI